MRFPADVPTLTEGDVTLRAHLPEDVPGVVEQCRDPLSQRWTTVPVDYGEAHGREFVADRVPGGWESGSDLGFAIECTHPDGVRRFGGSVSLRPRGEDRYAVGFGAHPAVRGRGVMTTAVGLLLDWGFDALTAETMIWWAHRGNLASRRVAWRQGFTIPDGHLPRWEPQRGELLDCWVGTLHRDDVRRPRTPWLRAPVLQGRSVRLRPLTEGDTDRIVEGCADARTRHWLAFLPQPYTAADAQEYLLSRGEQQANGSGLWWAVADPDTDELIGNIGYPRVGREEGEIGYWTHPHARGRGVMSEAVGLAARHAFVPAEDGGLGWRRVYLKAAEGNAASAQVARSNGFTECGRERRSERLADGSYVDLLVFDRLADE